MFKTILISALCILTGIAHANCLSEQQLSTLVNKESEYLINKVPPAFKHGLEDKGIRLNMNHVLGEQCSIALTVTLPLADIKEANAILDAQPAKKIMLAAQGQGLPQTEQSTARFKVDSQTFTVSTEDQLQTSELGKLRASIELMYALITQERALIQPEQTNTIAWTKQDIEKVTNACGEKNTADFCQCMAGEYAHRISPNQMDYIQYIRANPYALATGVNQQFEVIKQTAEQSCKG